MQRALRPGNAGGGAALRAIFQGALIVTCAAGVTVLGAVLYEQAMRPPASAEGHVSVCILPEVPGTVLHNDALSPQFRAQQIADSDDAHMTLWGAGYELRLGLRWTRFVSRILGLDLADWDIQAP